MYHKNRIRLCILCLLLLLAACQPATPTSKPVAEFSSEVATRWFELQLKLIKETPGFTPPVASRALGYSGVALYESVIGGMPKYNSLVGQLNALTLLPQLEAGQTYYWPAAANSALATMLRDLYPTATPENLAAVDALEAQYAAQYKSEASEEAFNRSADYGRTIADAIFEWSKDDGGHEGYLRNFPESYTPPSGTGMWVPTPPGYSRALQPTWGNNRPFVIQSGDVCMPAPPSYSEDPASEFYSESMEVYETVKNLTPEQREIALFWADDPGTTFTPPGHSISIATQVLHEKNASLEMAAEAYAKIGISVSDAFIGCWNAKYAYNLIRPITYIQSMIDPSWDTPEVTDPVITPPFPEYTSGHSVQSGAAAIALTNVFGDNYHFSDSTHVDRGMAPRSFDSFFAAANEAAISRLYGGIHYRSAIELGVDQGKCIGERVMALAWKQAPAAAER